MPIEGMPEEYAENPALQDFNDIGALAGAYLNTKSMVGNSIRIPGPDASDEDRTTFANKLVESAPNLMQKPDFNNQTQAREFYRTLGMPETPQGYSRLEFNDLPEGVTIDDKKIQAFAKIAHEAGLTDAQFKEAASKYIGTTIEESKANLEAIAQNTEELKSEWGHAYEDRMKTVTKFFELSKAPQAIIDAAKAGMLDAATAKWALEVSNAIGNEPFGEINGNPGQQPGGKLSPDEAKQRIHEIMNNKQHAYWNQADPDHPAALLKMVELRGMADPKASTDPNFFKASP